MKFSEIINNIFKAKQLTYKQDNNHLSYKKDSQDTLTISLEKSQPSIYRKELDQWQAAKMAFLNNDNPKTYLLQEVYNDAMLDAHLSANVLNRINRLKNKSFLIKDKDGNITDKSQYLESKWFLKVVEYAIESIIYGYSLIYIKKAIKGQIIDVELIDRKHIIPQKNIIVKNVDDEKGFDYTLFPNYLLMVQMGDSLGLLDKAIPLTILKRHSWANWDEFEQLFGIPIRIARTMDNTPQHKQELQKMLDQMGTAATAVLPKSVDIEFKENNKNDSYNIFLQKIKIINEEISKLFNGQTMTIDNGSSYSQSQVHQNTEDSITKSDIMSLEFWLNDTLLPAMRNIGYDIGDTDYIDIVENNITSPFDKIKIDTALMQNGYVLDKDYLETTYDTKINQIPQKDTQNSLGFFD